MVSFIDDGVTMAETYGDEKDVSSSVSFRVDKISREASAARVELFTSRSSKKDSDRASSELIHG
jgi:hypothetical protein